MKRVEGDDRTGDDVPTLHYIVLARLAKSPGAPYSKGVTYHATRPMGLSHHAVLVEVCVELVSAASAEKAGEEEAEDVDGHEAAVDGEEG